MSLDVAFWGWDSLGLGSVYVWGWEDVTGAVVFPTPLKPRKQKAHGWNKYRLLQWGGKYKPR